MVNNENNNKDNDTRKIVTMIAMVCVLMLCTTGATYAFFALTANNAVATGTAASASLTLTVTEATLGGTSSGTTKTGKMVPQKEATLSTAMGTSYACVDGNGNTVCKVYTITVTNGSSAAVKLNGTIQFSGNGSMANLKFRRTTSATSLGNYTTAAVGTDTSSVWDIITSGSTCVVANGNCTAESVAAGASKTYYIVVWINETNAIQTDSGTWVGTITFQGEKGTGITSTITG